MECIPKAPRSRVRNLALVFRIEPVSTEDHAESARCLSSRGRRSSYLEWSAGWRTVPSSSISPENDHCEIQIGTVSNPHESGTRDLTGDSGRIRIESDKKDFGYAASGFCGRARVVAREQGKHSGSELERSELAGAILLDVRVRTLKYELKLIRRRSQRPSDLGMSKT